jgi:hypothetical protein
MVFYPDFLITPTVVLIKYFYFMPFIPTVAVHEQIKNIHASSCFYIIHFLLFSVILFKNILLRDSSKNCYIWLNILIVRKLAGIMEGPYSLYPGVFKNHGVQNMTAQPLINNKIKQTKVSGLSYCGYTIPLHALSLTDR